MFMIYLYGVTNASGEVMTFKFYDAANDVVIDLNETYTFTSNDVVGDGFNPFVLTGNSVVCEDDDEDGDECVTGDDIDWEKIMSLFHLIMSLVQL